MTLGKLLIVYEPQFSLLQNAEGFVVRINVQMYVSCFVGIAIQGWSRLSVPPDFETSRELKPRVNTQLSHVVLLIFLHPRLCSRDCIYLVSFFSCRGWSG